MKLVIASDIHGSAYYCKKLLENYRQENADKLVLLGDLLYHGPRNALPEEYDPKLVAAMLNEFNKEIISIRGNCDAEVDQMMLDFPTLADYSLLYIDGYSMYVTHGHVYNDEVQIPMKKGDILLSGHTHIPACKEVDCFLSINPGSVSIPKSDSKNSFVVYEDGVFYWKTMDGTCYQQCALSDIVFSSMA